MKDEIRENEKKLEELKSRKELLKEEQDIAEAEAMIKRAKREGGSNFKKIFGLVGKLKVNGEAIQDLYNCNLDGLKEESKLVRRR